MSEALEPTLAALADPSRRKVVEALCEAPLRAGELAGRVGVTPAALSRHLRVLKSVGLIEEMALPHDARVRMYILRPLPMAELKAWLIHIEGLWTHQLSTLKTHI